MPLNAIRKAAIAGPTNDAEAVERARRDVRGGQLLGRSGEQRHQRGLGGAEDRAEDRGDRRDDVDGERRGIAGSRARRSRRPRRGGRGRRRASRARAGSDRASEAANGAISGGDHLANGRDDARRPWPRRAGRRRLRSPRRRRSCRSTSPGVGELDSPQVRVREDALQRAERLCELATKLAHRARQLHRFDKKWKGTGRFRVRTPSSRCHPPERVNVSQGGFKMSDERDKLHENDELENDDERRRGPSARRRPRSVGRRPRSSWRRRRATQLGGDRDKLT